MKRCYLVAVLALGACSGSGPTRYPAQTDIGHGTEPWVAGCEDQTGGFKELRISGADPVGTHWHLEARLVDGRVVKGELAGYLDRRNLGIMCGFGPLQIYSNLPTGFEYRYRIESTDAGLRASPVRVEGNSPFGPPEVVDTALAKSDLAEACRSYREVKAWPTGERDFVRSMILIELRRQLIAKIDADPSRAKDWLERCEVPGILDFLEKCRKPEQFTDFFSPCLDESEIAYAERLLTAHVHPGRRAEIERYVERAKAEIKRRLER